MKRLVIVQKVTPSGAEPLFLLPPVDALRLIADGRSVHGTSFLSGIPLDRWMKRHPYRSYLSLYESHEYDDLLKELGIVPLSKAEIMRILRPRNFFVRILKKCEINQKFFHISYEGNFKN